MAYKKKEDIASTSLLTRRIAQLWELAEVVEDEFASRNLQVELSVTLSCHEPQTLVCINRLDATRTHLSLLEDATI